MTHEDRLVPTVAPYDAVPTDPGCACPAAIQTASGFFVDPGPADSVGGVRYANGYIRMTDPDLMSGGFGFNWGRGRTWTNDPGIFVGAESPNGEGIVDCETPSV